MIPFSPGLSVRPLDVGDVEAAAPLVNRMLAHAPFSAPMDTATLQTQLYAANPPTLHPMRWQQRLLLGAWRAGVLVGLLDAATGQDRDSAQLPDYHPLGIVRFLVLPEAEALAAECAEALLAAAMDFWRRQGVAHVKAFHISTGYSCFQAGAGLLPGDWAAHVRLLMGAGFHFTERYYCLARPLEQLLEETVPQGSLSIAFRGDREDRRYQLFFRRTELVAEARLVPFTAVEGEQSIRIAYLAHWEVDERWRNQRVGRWLLRRLINDGTQQGLAQLVVHLQFQQAAAMNLLAQHGFVELNYRGYTLEKSLAAL